MQLNHLYNLIAKLITFEKMHRLNLLSLDVWRLGICFQVESAPYPTNNVFINFGKYHHKISESSLPGGCWFSH